MTVLFFEAIVNMSITASILAVCVMILRLILKKAPKWIIVLLWGFVALRLVCPVTVQSPYSLMPNTELQIASPVSEVTKQPEPDTIEVENYSSFANITVEYQTNEPIIEVQRSIDWRYVCLFIWLVGMGILLLYLLVSYVRLYRRVAESIRLCDNVYQGEHVSSPFVLGIVKPRIFVPFSLDGEKLDYVISHERAHIHRLDHLWKPFGFLLLTVHWFNPIMWLAYVLLCRDIESACDERVVRRMTDAERADYSEALLSCSVRSRAVSACPLAFGEVGVKKRIESVLKYKKPALLIVSIALAVCVAVAVFFMTSPKEYDIIEKIANEQGYEIISQEDTELTIYIEVSRIMSAITDGEEYNSLEPLDRYVQYSSPEMTMILESINQVNSDENKLLFTYNMTYTLPDDKGEFIYPWELVNGNYRTSVSVVDKRLYTEGKSCDNAVLHAGQGNGNRISFYVSKDALLEMGNYASFKIKLNKVSYLADYERDRVEESRLVEDAYRVAGVRLENLVKDSAVIREADGNGVEVLFSDAENTVWLGVSYNNEGILEENPFKEYYMNDPYIRLEDKYPMIPYYAIQYASNIGGAVSDNYYSGSSTGSVIRLEEVKAVKVGTTDTVTLYYTEYWKGKGLALPGETSDYKIFPLYFAFYSDGREEQPVINLGYMTLDELQTGYNNPVMKSRWGDEYTAAAMGLYSEYVGTASDEDMVLDAYAGATEAASWFRIGALSPEAVDGVPVHSVNVGDIRYYKASRFETYEEFKRYLLGFFSQQLVEEFLLYGNYIDYNGALYSTGGARGADISKGRESYKVKKVSPSKYELEVTVEILGGLDDLTVVDYETYIFIYEQWGDYWVFTEFPSIR